MIEKAQIRRAAVLGAGVMGAQIAALLANAGIRVDLLDLPDDEAPDGRARSGRDGLLKSRPPALFVPEYADRITTGSLDDLSCLREADWIVEAVVERLDVKRELLARVEAAARPAAVISTNTSGLSVGAMAAECSEAFRRRFLGIHFFNPPRLMKLVELVPGSGNDPDLVSGMRRFLEEELGKGTVVARDTPNFIANRLGVFAIMQALHGMEERGLNVETVDAVSGPLLGRPRSATLRLCDLIGLDTLVHVANTAREQLPDEAERETFTAPDFVRDMMERNLLGVKTGAGFYRKGERGIEAIDLGTMEFRATVEPDLGPLATAVGERTLGARLQALWPDESPAGRFARGNLCHVLAYAAAHGREMADDLVQIDQAMRWGFNWEAGPFEVWDAVGIDTAIGALPEFGIPPPELAMEVADGAGGRFYQVELGETRIYSPTLRAAAPVPSRSTADFENDRGYVAPLREGIGALVFDSKMNVLGPAALELARRVLEENRYRGLVLWGAGEPFSVGADLEYMVGLSERGEWQELEGYVRDFQDAIMGLRYAPVPVVAAPKGLTLGGGCEFCLGADERVAVAELRIGLVETRVGLIPAGGGCKELVRRERGLLRGYQTIVLGSFTDNARQGQGWHLLDEGDEVLMNAEGQLSRATAKAIDLAEAGYQSPIRAPVAVAGGAGEAEMAGWLEAGIERYELSEHDLLVGRRLAWVMSGGGGAPRQVDEQGLLDLEREVFMELCGTGKSRERMAHMIQTGKVLRN